MKVTKDVVVSMAYRVKNEEGVIVDELPATKPLEYLHGHSSLISGLENALTDHVAGDKFTVSVAANDAYGDYNEHLVQRVPKESFTGVDNLDVGMRFIADSEQGQIPVEITEVGDDYVVVDGNHPLAGQDLIFDIEIISLRPATEEEKQHGHLHGEHGGCGGHHGDNDDDGCCGGHGGCGCH